MSNRVIVLNRLDERLDKVKNAVVGVSGALKEFEGDLEDRELYAEYLRKAQKNYDVAQSCVQRSEEGVGDARGRVHSAIRDLLNFVHAEPGSFSHLEGLNGVEVMNWLYELEELDGTLDCAAFQKAMDALDWSQSELEAMEQAVEQ